MEYSIAINKQDVMESVKKITGYTGKNIGERVDNIAITDDEANIIETLSEKSITDFLSKISRFMPVYTGNAVKVELPKTFDAKVLPLLSKGVEDLVTNDACSCWFFIARLEDDAKKYSEMTVNCFQNVLRLLCARVKPI